MPILPLPQYEADLEADRKAYEALRTPRTLVVRFGVMKLVGEFHNDSGVKPGCGSKLVVRTHRGTEIGEMLTSTCPNSGCSKSISRQQMLEYVENSGGRDYPFFQEGRVLRVATAEDMARQERLEQSRHGIRLEARRIAEEMRAPIKIVDAEPLLGDERLFIYYYSEDRVDLHDLAPRLARLFHNRVELRQVGARDEARITADYERCGQYCCCKNFLKVLKPISMKSAKVQKATLDPLKISGRCGRLMCCLRYEDETYESLRKRLPRKKSRVGTPEGDGTVIDAQILTQLVLVLLDVPEPDGKIRQVAVPVENLTEPHSSSAPPPTASISPPMGRPAHPRHGSPCTPQSGPPADPGSRPHAQRSDQPADRPPQRPPQNLPQRPAQGQGAPRPAAGAHPRGRTGTPADRGPGPQGRPPSAAASEDRRRPPAPSREPDDFSEREIDDLVDDPSQGDPQPESPGLTPGQGDHDGARRRRKRRRRRGRGGPPGPQGPDGSSAPGDGPRPAP